MRRDGFGRKIVGVWLVLLTVLSLWSCGDRPPQVDSQSIAVSGIAEAAPPKAIEELRSSLEQYQPQVEIVSPQGDRVLQDTTVEVQIQVQDFPLFKDEERQMGPHLHLILDNQPYRAVYSVAEPVVLEDLAPGTHTLRVFASRPWHESFKNEGAYAQTTFHIFTRTDNAPDPALPLLTYSRPKGRYGAEPIMLDFYLTNAPLHLVAQEAADDDIADWQIRATVNGQSFFLEDWQPVYLKGFQAGKNWVQLELLDGQGNPIENAFNNTARLIDYAPNGQDTLSKLLRGELSAQAARSIVTPNVSAEAVPPEPSSEELPPVEPPATEPIEEPTVESPPELNEELLESTNAETEREEIAPPPEPGIEPDILAEPTEAPEASEPIEVPTELTEPEPSVSVDAPPPEALTDEKPERLGKFFRRLRSPEITPSPSPEPLLPEIVAPDSEELEPGLIETQPNNYAPSEPPKVEALEPPTASELPQQDEEK